jgi:hypothetical protein
MNRLSGPVCQQPSIRRLTYLFSMLCADHSPGTRAVAMVRLAKASPNSGRTCFARRTTVVLEISCCSSRVPPGMVGSSGFATCRSVLSSALDNLVPFTTIVLNAILWYWTCKVLFLYDCVGRHFDQRFKFPSVFRRDTDDED